MQSTAAATNDNPDLPSIDTRLADHRKLLGEVDAYEGSASDSHDEDDSNVDEAVEHDSQSVVGVSINKQQSWLASPTTPAVDKAAILSKSDARDWVNDVSQDYFAGVDTIAAAKFSTRNTGTTSASHYDLPSPWIAGPRDLQFNRTDESSSALRQGRRPRASTGPSSSPRDDSPKKLSYFLPSLPKLGSVAPRLSLPSVSSALSFLQLTNSDHASSNNSKVTFLDAPRTLMHVRSKSEQEATPRLALEQGVQATRSHSSQPSREPPTPTSQQSGTPLLRRSTSDHSIYLRRQLSRASSLGDDSRWANIHGQVNSRFQAIKDSLADSSIRLPRMPNISLNFANSDPVRGESQSNSSEWMSKERSGSAGGVRKGFTETKRPKVRSKSHTNVKHSAEGAPKPHAELHPHFNKMLKDLAGDVVVLGGYRGSILRSAEAPHRQLWVPIKVGLNIRKVNLEVGLDDEDEEKMPESIIPSGMLRNIGPVDISRRLFKRLRSCENARNGTLRVWDYGYDWRLSPHRLSTELISYLEKLPCNQTGVPEHQRGALVLAHSLGGLISRHAINQRPELFSGILYAGVPQTCVNILGPLRNGDDVLLSSKVLTAQVNFTIRTSFALLPLDGKCFVDSETGQDLPVDFFDPKTWQDHCLSPCVASPLPPLKPPTTASTSSSSATNSSSIHSSSSDNPSSSSSSSTSVLGSISHVLPSVALRGRSRSISRSPQLSDPTTNPSQPAHPLATTLAAPDPPTSTSISPGRAYSYLCRTLAATRAFKHELAPVASTTYPPAAVIYGKSIPTVSGARVRGGYRAIRHADAYDDLRFGSGDGVVLAAAAQLPDGYRCARGGCVSSERGHIGLLGDLEAVGRAVGAILEEKKRRREGRRRGRGREGVKEEDGDVEKQLGQESHS